MHYCAYLRFKKLDDQMRIEMKAHIAVAFGHVFPLVFFFFSSTLNKLIPSFSLTTFSWHILLNTAMDNFRSIMHWINAWISDTIHTCGIASRMVNPPILSLYLREGRGERVGHKFWAIQKNVTQSNNMQAIKTIQFSFAEAFKRVENFRNFNKKSSSRKQNYRGTRPLFHKWWSFPWWHLRLKFPISACREWSPMTS